MKFKLAALKIFSLLGILKPIRIVKNKLLSYCGIQLVDSQKLGALYSQFLTTGDLFFDVGANEGGVVETVLGMDCKMVAVEANPTLAEKLKNKFQYTSMVSVEAAALTDSPGEVEFHISDEMPELSSVSKDWLEKGIYAGACQWNRTVTVPAITLDSLIEKYGVPQFIKIDVEGHEYAVLSGLSRPIDYLSFEFSGKLLDSTDKCVLRLDQIARDHSRTALFNYSLGKSYRLDPAGWISAPKLIEIFRSMQDDLAVGDVYCKTMIET